MLIPCVFTDSGTISFEEFEEHWRKLEDQLHRLQQAHIEEMEMSGTMRGSVEEISMRTSLRASMEEDSDEEA
jgi:hypothetical protein